MNKSMEKAIEYLNENFVFNGTNTNTRFFLLYDIKKAISIALREQQTEISIEWRRKVEFLRNEIQQLYREIDELKEKKVLK